MAETKTPAANIAPDPEESRSALLTTIGFYRLSLRQRKLLSILFGISLSIHVAVLLVFGGWIVMRSRMREATTFVTPPPARRYEPRKLEHRVKIKKRQRSSSRPAMVPRLVAMKMTRLALPEIQLDPKIIHTTFQPKFKAVSGKGLGAGLGNGYGTHGFGEGVSAIDFFGIHARGEKVAVMVDVSVSMVEEERGGVAGYNKVRSRIERVIDALAEGTLFNLMVFADAASAFEEQMVIGNNDNKTKAKLFLRPFNTEGNWGLTDGNLKPADIGKKAHGGTTRLDLPLTAAFEQGADTILIISDGIPRVRKAWSAEQLQAFQMRRQEWLTTHAGELREWEAAAAAHVGTTERVWVPPAAARPAGGRPLKEGQPVDRGSPAVPGHWTTVHRGYRQPRPAPPPIPDPGFWTLADFVEHLRVLHEKVYKEKGRKPPVIHCIGYQIDRDGRAFLKGLAREFHGQYRGVTRVR